MQTGLSQRRVAVQLGFTEGALRKRLKLDCGVVQLGRFKCVFNGQQDRDLAQHARTLEKMFYGLTFKSLRQLAFQFARANDIPNPFSEDKQMAGKDWAYSFMKKHKFSLRTPSKTSVARVMGFNKIQIDLYFSNLRNLIEKYKFPSTRIFNMDESGLSTVPNKTPKIVSPRGQKTVGKIVSAERGQTVSIVCCMSAAGLYVPPAIIFPRKRRKPELIDGAPPGSILLTSESGYSNTDLFLEWLVHFQNHVKASEEDPALLILDNHTSHTSLKAVLFAREHNIQMLSLSPHSSHKTQPLDRCFFKPLKDFYSQACEKWLLCNPGRTITQYQIAQLFSQAYEKAASIGKAVTSFKVCGIFPFNPAVFSEEDFLPSSVTDQHGLFVENIQDEMETEDTTPIPSKKLRIDTSTSEEVTHITPLNIPSAKIEVASVTAITSTSKLPAEPSTSGSTASTSKLSAEPSTSDSTGTNSKLPVEPPTNGFKRVAKLSSTKLIASPNNSAHISPQQILPLPKKKGNVIRQGNRKGKKSIVLTSTPVKDELEEAEKSREEKKNKGKKNVFGSQADVPTVKKTSFERNLETNKKLETSGDDTICPGCEESFSETPNDDWVQCNYCKEWWHEACSSFEGKGAFRCDYC